MRKNLILTLCAALLFTGCECLDCGGDSFSVTPPIVYLGFDGDDDFPINYTSHSGTVAVSSSHSWTAQPTQHVILDSYAGNGGQSLVKLEFTQEFMENLCYNIDDFPQDEHGIFIETIYFVSSSGKTGEAKVYYDLGFVLNADKIVMLDTPWEKQEGPKAPTAPEASSAPEMDGNKNYLGYGSMEFWKTLTMQATGVNVDIAGSSFTPSTALTQGLQAYTTQIYNTYSDVFEGYNAYSSAAVYYERCIELLEELLQMDCEAFFRIEHLDLNLDFAFHNDKMLHLCLFGQGYAGFEPVIQNARLIDIIREFWQYEDVALGSYAITISDSNGISYTKTYEVYLDGRLLVLDGAGFNTACGSVDLATSLNGLSSVTQVELTAENFFSTLYLSNSFGGRFDVEFKPFTFGLGGPAITIDAGEIFETEHPLNPFNQAGDWFSIQYYNPGYSGGNFDLIDWTNIKTGNDWQWPYSPTLHKTHMICLHDSFLVTLVRRYTVSAASAPMTKAMVELTWQIPQTLGIVTYRDKVGNEHQVELVLNMTPEALRAIYGGSGN
jgi:hypothetical protein